MKKKISVKSLSHDFWIRFKNNVLLFLTLSQAAWVDFCKAWVSWVMLAAGAIIFMALSITANQGLVFFLIILDAIYTAILHQNALDSAYGRKLSMIKMTPLILFASLFFIAASSYNPFELSSELLLLALPEDFMFFMVLNFAVRIFICYLLVRCMFVGMIVLEEKCNIIDAFRKSFKLTSHHLLLLFGVFLYLGLLVALPASSAIMFIFYAAAFAQSPVMGPLHIVIAFALSVMTIVGYFVVLPYTIIMKALLFKKLNEMVK